MPTTALKEHALKLARAHCELDVGAGLKVLPNLTMRSGAGRPRNSRSRRSPDWHPGWR